jgi:hypothetical protein
MKFALPASILATIFLIFAIGFDIFSDESLPARPKVIEFQPVSSNEGAKILKSQFFLSSSKEAQGFEKMEGQEIGLDMGYQYDIRDYTDPFWFGRGTASGDYDKDGWQDILFGSNSGFYLYKNVAGRFVQQDLSLEAIEDLQVYAVAFIDLNNDGWPDIFFTTFNEGNFLILNREGTFDTNHLISVPNRDAVLTLSPAFSDLDGNGYLDIVNGNIALGVVTGLHVVDSKRHNSVVFNRSLKFKEAPIESDSGETMASLISDINNDGIKDIYFGNDFFSPDTILLGTGKGYTKVKGNEFIPYTPFYSMGADTGDINNDLKLDFLVTGTMYTAPFVGKQPIDGVSVEEYSKFKGTVKTCDSIKNEKFRDHCRNIRETEYIRGLDRTQIMTQINKNEEPENCSKHRDKIDRDICLTKRMWALITDKNNPENCEATYGSDERLLTICEILKIRQRKMDRQDLYGSIPQDDRNMLYTFDASTKALKAVEGFKHPGGWTWNSRIADLDNDGWQDVVTADGTVRTKDYGWNVLMKNIDGKSFEQRQFSQGIVSDFGLYSFVVVDMDNDGDLDLIGNSAEGPVQVYKNNSTGKNNSLAISLIDPTGNHFGVGAKIIVRSKESNLSQIREIKASGGYMSFEPPVAYFGLGKEKTIDHIEVKWPDNTTKVYSGPFEANHHYRIVRQEP